ncbi:glycerophosphoryl diester phosphodiesterase membrane domain-containing protein [Actinomycetospora sp. C-140]
MPEVSGPASGDGSGGEREEQAPEQARETTGPDAPDQAVERPTGQQTAASDVPGDEPTPPHGTPGPAAVPAWDPGAGSEGGPGQSAGQQHGGPQPGPAGPGGFGHPAPAGPPGAAYGGPTGYGQQGYGQQPPPGPPYGGGAPGGFPGGFGGPPRAPKPGIVPLRPLGLGEILDGALGYIRAHPRVVLGTSAVVAVITQALATVLQVFVLRSTTQAGTTPDLAQLTSLLAGTGITGVVTTIVTIIAVAVLTGILMVTISRSVLGAPVEAGEVWRAARPRIPGVIGVSLLVALIAVGLVVIGTVPGLLLLLVDGTLGGVVIALGVIAAIVVAIWISVSLSLATPAYVLEGIGVTEALRRSWFLVRGRFWPVFGIQLLGGLIAFVIAGVITAPFQLVGTLLAGGSDNPAAATTSLPVLLLTALGAIIGYTLTTPFQSGVTGLLYVDQRMRREGFDIELQRAAAGGR